MRNTILATLVAAAALTGCGGDDGADKRTVDSATATTAEQTDTTAEQTETIKIEDFTYEPTPATVQSGQKISINNTDAAPHTLTHSESPRVFDSGTIEGKATGSLTIDKPGTYSYFCEFHPFMKGEITVTE